MVTADTVRIGAMTLKISRRQKQDRVFYDMLFDLCERLLPGCGCDVVLLPERSALGPEDRQPLDGPHLRQFASLARRHGLYLLAPLAELDGQACFNTHVVISPAGELVHAYRKVHLAPGEEKSTMPGSGFAAFDLPWFRAGLMICFDNHFPESSRLLALAGARVLFWPAFGNLARPAVDAARCIDSDVYVVASGVVDMACGLPADAFNCGAVFDPTGHVIARTDAADGLATVDLPLESGRLAHRPPDPNYLDRRRPTAYGPLA
ncbi:MAG: hypothetical protein BIFFINMI_01081 [Phycisphaerae bacterium]|nr:hypothetical protein [Phycisphaerae bacterium]